MLGKSITAQLLLVFEQIDAYKRSEARKFEQQLAAIGKADTDGEQAQGQAPESRASLPQRKPEAET